MAKKNYQLHLKGYVGGWDFDSNYVDYVLSKNQDGPVSVLIDSTGGSLATALSIVAAFRQHGDVSVHYVGMNASAATIASLGAKHVSIDSSAMYLVHKCSSGFFQYGSFNADQLSTLIDKCEQMKSDLDKMDANVASMYARKCKKSPEDLLELMKKGGWLTAQEALDWGFVDEITDLEEDSAPVLTEAIAASMNMAGMPVPNLPYSMPSSDEQTIIQRFISALTSFFRDNGTNTDKKTTCPSEMTAGPSGETSATVHTHGEKNGEQTADATPGKEVGQSQGDETQSNTMTPLQKVAIKN